MCERRKRTLFSWIEANTPFLPAVTQPVVNIMDEKKNRIGQIPRVAVVIFEIRQPLCHVPIGFILEAKDFENCQFGAKSPHLVTLVENCDKYPRISPMYDGPSVIQYSMWPWHIFHLGTNSVYHRINLFCCEQWWLFLIFLVCDHQCWELREQLVHDCPHRFRLHSLGYGETPTPEAVVVLGFLISNQGITTNNFWQCNLRWDFSLFSVIMFLNYWVEF